MTTYCLHAHCTNYNWRLENFSEVRVEQRTKSNTTKGKVHRINNKQQWETGGRDRTHSDIKERGDKSVNFILNKTIRPNM